MCVICVMFYVCRICFLLERKKDKKAKSHE